MVTPHFNLSEAINEPVDVLSHTLSCIVLIFTSKSNLVMHPGVDLSLHSNYQHQIVFFEIQS